MRACLFTGSAVAMAIIEENGSVRLISGSSPAVHVKRWKKGKSMNWICMEKV